MSVESPLSAGLVFLLHDDASQFRFLFVGRNTWSFPVLFWFLEFLLFLDIPCSLLRIVGLVQVLFEIIAFMRLEFAQATPKLAC